MQKLSKKYSLPVTFKLLIDNHLEFAAYSVKCLIITVTNRICVKTSSDDGVHRLPGGLFFVFLARPFFEKTGMLLFWGSFVVKNFGFGEFFPTVAAWTVKQLLFVGDKVPR